MNHMVPPCFFVNGCNWMNQKSFDDALQAAYAAVKFLATLPLNKRISKPPMRR